MYEADVIEPAPVPADPYCAAMIGPVRRIAQDRGVAWMLGVVRLYGVETLSDLPAPAMAAILAAETMVSA